MAHDLHIGDWVRLKHPGSELIIGTVWDIHGDRVTVRWDDEDEVAQVDAGRLVATGHCLDPT